MRWLLILVFLAVGCSDSTAAEKTISELDALKIKVLFLERQLIEAKVSALQCQAAAQFKEKAKELDTTVEAAAKTAGVDLKDGWQPDVERRVWKKGK